ncbi:MAG: tetratricopeptide repeat protein [Planctomycetota bacterium]
MRRFLILAALLPAACAVPTQSAADADRTAAAPANLFPGLEGAHRRIAATAAAQPWFDQGLILTYGFNHDEAVRSFQAAAAKDATCAMAAWGEAYALGPNINLPMEDPEVAAQAHAAAQRAYDLRQHESDANRALIEALVHRYDAEAPAERAHLDQAYAEAMRDVWQQFPRDPDVGALYAESLLDLHPWETWTKDGQPMDNILEVRAVLERVMELAEDHPLANHLYIHAMEASPWPELAEPSADRLRAMFPGAGHLVHMPAHIYINVGRYRDAEEANRLAIGADRAYFDKVGPQGIYEFYRAHNHHFRVYAAMFGGRRDVAVQSARDLVADLPPSLLEGMPGLVDGFLAVPLHAMIRFGQWQDVLDEPYPEGEYPIAQALWHYAHGIALAATGKVDDARAAQAKFAAAADAVPEDAVIGINPAPPVIEVARHMLAGEILYRAGDFDAAFDELNEAVRREDALRYDEPSPWMQPVRHALGALLLEQHRIAEAEAVYQEDLERHRENGWALHGLAECRRQRGADAEAEALEARYRRAFAAADIDLAASCFCRVAAGAAAPACE